MKTTLKELIAFALEAGVQAYEAEARAYEDVAKVQTAKAEVHEEKVLWQNASYHYGCALLSLKIASQLRKYPPSKELASQARDKVSAAAKGAREAQDKASAANTPNMFALWETVQLLRGAEARLWEAVAVEHDRSAGTPDANDEASE